MRKKLTFKHIGKNVKISPLASFHNAEHISIGDNTRIDDFCVLSAGIGGITIGSHVHISAQASIIGKETIAIGDFSSMSVKTAIFSSNDDYSGKYMANPTVPEIYTNVQSKPVIIGRHVIIGSGTVILPGVTIEDGVAIGALSLIKSDCKRFNIYAGTPAKKIKPRSKKLLTHERKYYQNIDTKR